MIGKLETPDSASKGLRTGRANGSSSPEASSRLKLQEEQLLQDESAIRERQMFQLKAGQHKEEFSLTFARSTFFFPIQAFN